MASVKVQMIQPEALDFIKEISGMGTMMLNGARPSRPNSKPLYQWGIRNRNDIVPFLENVIPFLKVKKNRAKFLLEYCNKSAYWGMGGARYFGLPKEELEYREESYRKMRELNGTKVAATTNSPGPERACDSLSS